MESQQCEREDGESTCEMNEKHAKLDSGPLS
jgi:hypothetical protein